MPIPRGLHALSIRKLCCCSPCDACPPAAANPHTRSRAVGRARCGISRPWWSPVLRPDPRSSGVGVLYMYSPCNVLKKPKVECRVWFIGLVSSNKFSHFTGMPSFLKTAYCIAFSRVGRDGRYDRSVRFSNVVSYFHENTITRRDRQTERPKSRSAPAPAARRPPARRSSQSSELIRAYSNSKPTTAGPISRA